MKSRNNPLLSVLALFGQLRKLIFKSKLIGLIISLGNRPTPSKEKSSVRTQ